MAQEADFCGGRLRLSAFLRVVGDGMPQRPTRFRRRQRAADDFPEASTSHATDCTDMRITVIQHEEISHEDEHFKDTSVLDTSHSTLPEHPTLAPEDPLPESTIDSGVQSGGCQQPEADQHPIAQRKAGKRTPTALTTNSPSEPCKMLSTRKKRRLPVNELALLRTTSSNSLPRPSVRSMSQGR